MHPHRPVCVSAAAAVVCVAAAFAVPARGAGRSAGPMSFVTLVSGLDQARSAEAMIASIRRFGGPYRDAPIYVVVDNPDHVPFAALHGPGVRTLPLDMDAAAKDLPFAAKAFAASQVEALLAGRRGTLAWLDADTLILAPPRLLDLDRRHAVALRPVHLVNTVGQAPETPVDAYWQAVYRVAGVDPQTVPTVETAVDAKPVRFYVNCAVIAWRLGRDIGPRWARAVSALARDRVFLGTHGADPLRRIFLHQAALSAVLLTSTNAAERRWLPLDHGYPLHLHERLPEARRAQTLDRLPCVIVGDLWREGRALPPIGVSPSLQAWLEGAWRRTFEVVPGILRQEGECNTYLLRTDAGDVVIDPGGAPDPTGPLRRLHEGRPLLAVLLTHGHPDHRAGIATWIGGGDVPVIAQRLHAEMLAEQNLIAPLLARRSAMVTGAPDAPSSPDPGPARVEATVFFDDRHAFAPGDLRIEMIHAPSETPDTAIVWVPALRAAFVGDMFFSSFPNFSTLRGGRTRSATEYVRALEAALALEPDLLLPGHGEPVFGRDVVRRRLAAYRDAVVWVRDAVLRGLREGQDAHTLMREIKLPEGLALPEAYGRVSWAVRGTYEAYAGWFDGRPESMYALPPTAAAVELARIVGSAVVAERARALLAAGDSVRALQLTEAALAAEPGNTEVLDVRLATLRALRASSRNFFERGLLRHAIREAEAARNAAPSLPPG